MALEILNNISRFKEIQDNFNQFDADKSGNSPKFLNSYDQGTIDRKELKACLYSLGEEKSNTEVADILKRFGNSQGVMPYEGFRVKISPEISHNFQEFMIEVLGDADTQDEILNGFSLINKGGDVAKVNHLEQVLNDYDLRYITTTAPKNGDGFDYKKWTQDVFSR